MQQCPECKLPLQQPAARCPSCDADLTRYAKRRANPPKTEPAEVVEVRAVKATPPGMAAPRGTMVESVEALRAVPVAPPAPPPPRASNPADDTVVPTRARAAAAKTVEDRPREREAPAPVSNGNKDTWREPIPTQPDCTPFRPLNRPPMALLVALDDGSRDSGESFRVRQFPFVIGRTSGDAVIPHDSEISGRHAQITCRAEEGAWRWTLTDLESTNGTFLRVARVALRDGLQFLIGTRRYEFRAAASAAPATQPAPDNQSISTSRFQIPAAAAIERMEAAFVEITPTGDGRRYPLPAGDCQVGSGKQCGVQLIGDPFVSAVHARLTIDPQKRRILENQNSLNGLWVRIQEERIDQNCEFQCGEQRFLLRF